jgi:hypothetical protein
LTTPFNRGRPPRLIEAVKIIEAVLAQEGRKPESLFDFVQGVTGVARGKSHQHAQFDLEVQAKKPLDRAG